MKRSADLQWQKQEEMRSQLVSAPDRWGRSRLFSAGHLGLVRYAIVLLIERILITCGCLFELQFAGRCHLKARRTHISHAVRLPRLPLLAESPSLVQISWNNLELIMCFFRVLCWGLGWAMESRAGPGLVPACSPALWSGESCGKRQMGTERPEAGPGLSMQNSN